MLLNWNEVGAGGTTWPGWAWYPGGEGKGADDYGSAGWRKNDGHFYSAGTNWMPRIHEKTDYGNDCLATIDVTDKAPNTTTGASLKIHDTGVADKYQSCWWYLFGENFGTQSLADSSTNRFSFYFKPAGITSDPKTESTDNHSANIHFGTYLCWKDGGWGGENCPKEASNQHYYHHLCIHDGTWLHVLLDRHPQHQRGIKGQPVDNPASPKNYYQYINSFYLEIRNPQAGLTSYWVDEMEFYTEGQNENDISICSVWVGYWANTDKWEIGWNDGSFYDVCNEYTGSTFEIRYSTEPITNKNYGSALVIEPEFHEVGNTNLVRRPNTWKTVAWTRFELPDNTEQNNTRIYFAIKDVSVKGEHTGSWPYQYGDFHNAPSSHIHTIDYFIRKPIAIASASPTNGPAPLEVNFTCSGAGGNPPYTYQWAFGDGNLWKKTDQDPNSISHVTHSYASGNHTATFTVIDSSGIKDTSKIVIAVSSPVGGYI